MHICSKRIYGSRCLLGSGTVKSFYSVEESRSALIEHSPRAAMFERKGHVQHGLFFDSWIDRVSLARVEPFGGEYLADAGVGGHMLEEPGDVVETR
jgi:hypothetical protein